MARKKSLNSFIIEGVCLCRNPVNILSGITSPNGFGHIISLHDSRMPSRVTGRREPPERGEGVEEHSKRRKPREDVFTNKAYTCLNLLSTFEIEGLCLGSRINMYFKKSIK